MTIHDLLDDPDLLAQLHLARRHAKAVAEAAPYQVKGPFDYAHWSVTNNCWPVMPQPVQPKHTGLESPDTSSSSRAVASKMDGSCESNTKTDKTWYEPHGEYDARETEHRNAEAGPSTLPMLQPIQWLTPTTPLDIRRTGRSTDGRYNPPTVRPYNPPNNFAVTADAEMTTTKEENETPKPRPSIQYEVEWMEVQELCELMGRLKELDYLPTKNESLGYALEYIRKVRARVYQSPKFVKGTRKEGSGKSERGGIERKRRNEERATFEELSQYYERQDGSVWDGENLVREVLDDLKVRYPPPGLSTRAPKWAWSIL